MFFQLFINIVDFFNTGYLFASMDVNFLFFQKKVFNKKENASESF